MKYIYHFENIKHMTYDELMNYRRIKKYTPTEKLYHLIADEIYSQWEIIKERKNDDYSFFYDEFKKISIIKVKKLLSEGADINAHGNEGWGSLIKLAVYRQDLPLIKCLIENGANINGTDLDRKSSTPLYIAANINNPPKSKKILKFLIDNGSDINIPNDGQVLPLHHALFAECFENAIILLKAGSILKLKKNAFINKENDINSWMKVSNYEFQKTLCQMYPREISKINDNKIDDKIKKEFAYLFQANKFNI
jgi:ankyrin repeat protein